MVVSTPLALLMVAPGTLGPPAGCTLGTTYGDAHGLIASGTLAFGRARVKGNTKLYNNVCIKMP